jgi:hypothetical protein
VPLENGSESEFVNCTVVVTEFDVGSGVAVTGVVVTFIAGKLMAMGAVFSLPLVEFTLAPSYE